MDRNSPVKEDSSELTRELLIAISECLPENILDLEPVDESSYTANGTELSKEAREDKLRSDLISISYSPSPSPSPEKIALPATGTRPQDG